MQDKLAQLAHTSFKPEQIRAITILISLSGGMLILILPLPPLSGLHGQTVTLFWPGRAVLAVAVVCIALWVTEALPFAATALLAFGLLPLTDAYPGTLPQQFTRLLADSVGSPTVTFLLGVMVLGVAVHSSGLSLHIAGYILRLSAGRSRRVLLGFLATSAVLGMWITPVATASIMVPTAAGLLAQIGCRPGSSRFGKGLLMAVAWGSLSGGIATPAGATTNPIVIGFLHNLAGVEISFLDWIRIGIPILVLLIPSAWLLLVWLFPPEIDQCMWSASSAGISPQLTGFTGNQLRTALLLVGAIVTWIVSPAGWSPWSALLFGVILFIPYIGFLRWQDAERAISWEALLVVAAGIEIGNAAYQSGLARYLAHIFFAQILALPPFWRDMALSWATALIHALFSSNTVTGSIVAPLLIPLAQEFGLDAWRTMVPAAYSVSLAFLLVSEGPTSLIAYQTGYFSARDFTRAGLLLTLISGPILALMLLGMHVT